MNTSDTSDLQQPTIIIRPDWRFMQVIRHIFWRRVLAAAYRPLCRAPWALYSAGSALMLSQRWPEIFTTAGWAWIIVMAF
jgi:hypothetical protein